MKMRLIDADKIPFLSIPVAPVTSLDTDVVFRVGAFKEDVDQVPTVDIDTGMQWHPLRTHKDRPKGTGTYLATALNDKGNTVIAIVIYHEQIERFTMPGDIKEIIAWAEMPMPYVDGDEND